MDANLLALETLRTLQHEGRPATPDEQARLARWASWGAVPQIFDEQRTDYATERQRLRALLSPDEYAAARRTVINAHFTDASIVQEMWRTVRDLGFDTGTVLEPGSGVGNFIGFAPDTAHIIGVELDPTTAAISQYLYPDAQIRNEGFETTRIPRDTVDLVIGNVPFANVKLHDPGHNPGRAHSIHNHFIIKSLDYTRPGGLCAVVTSAFTMNAQNNAARTRINEMADLVGAVRLPNGAHQRAAGTTALTDILIFRKREPGTPPLSTAWETAPMLTIDGEKTHVNQYFLDHPEHVLGTHTLGHGQYGNSTLGVTGSLDTLQVDLSAALKNITDYAHTQGLTWGPRRTHEHDTPLAALLPAGTNLYEDFLVLDEDSQTIRQVREGALAEFPTPAVAKKELIHLLHLRDAARSLLELEAGSIEDNAAITTQRETLNAVYDDYHATYGPINRFRSTESTRNGKTVVTRRVPAALRTLGNTPFAALVTGLEIFNEESQTAHKAAIFTERQVVARQPTLTCDTPDDALAVCLDTRGDIDLRTIATLLGIEQTHARAALGDLVFDVPESAGGGLETRAEYCSGNVRTKLHQASEAAETDERFIRNVEALKAVMPRDLTPMDIHAKIGAPWIGTEVHLQFAQHILGTANVEIAYDGASDWNLKAYAIPPIARRTWGVTGAGPDRILQAALDQSGITIYSGDKEARTVDQAQTHAAADKMREMQEEFATWVWRSPARARHLTERYNERFNCLVMRDYSVEGERLTLPGLSKSWTPLPHQRAAVARMISEPTVGLFHEVGAGKTMEMAMGVMELKRLGLVQKPMLVVPNHMLGQFSREWMQAYPSAKILTASSHDLDKNARQRFVARAALSDWDCVIVTQGAFKAIPLSPENEAEYMTLEMSKHRDALAAVDADSGAGKSMIKEIEKKIARAEQAIKEKLDMKHDDGINFEQMGIDYLVVDEAHTYKNLATVSAIPGAAISGSQAATDMHSKIEYLRRTHGERVVTMATATPIANSITEMFVMQRYMRPDLLREAGIESFDAWAATFGDVVSEMQVTVTGGFKLKSRFAKFKNVPELLRMFSVFADVKTAEDLDLPTPDFRERSDGLRVPETVVVPPVKEVREFIQDLGRRAELIEGGMVSPMEDNMLKISYEGRSASLDLRLLQPDTTITGETKVSRAADILAEVYEDTKDNEYHDATGDISPTKGALQIVFCDLGVPSDKKWNVYDRLREELVDRGVPNEKIRFMHDATSDRAKERLFAAARSGEVAVLVGSTEKMGVGTNVQARAIHLLDLDAPWRPADLHQRHGRIMRRGNQNPEVRITQLVVEQSFDAYMWQTLERKARFISQVMRGTLDVREIDDVGDTVLGSAEAKALAAGNPLLMEKATADNDVSRLQSLHTAYLSNQRMLEFDREEATQRIKSISRVGLPKIEAAIARSVTTAGDAFAATMQLGPARPVQQFDSRTDMATAIQSWARANETKWRSPYRSDSYPEIFHLGGHTFNIRVAHSQLAPALHVTIKGAEFEDLRIGATDFENAHPGLVQRLENLVARLPQQHTSMLRQLNEANQRLSAIETVIDKPFPHQEALQAAREHAKDVNRQLDEYHRACDASNATPALPDPPAPRHVPQVSNDSSGVVSPRSTPEHRALLLASLHSKINSIRTNQRNEREAQTLRTQPTRPQVEREI